MAHLDESSLLVHVACSTAVRNGKLKRGNKPHTTQQAWAKTLLQSGLAVDKGAPMDQWAPLFQSGKAAEIITENLRFEYKQKVHQKL